MEANDMKILAENFQKVTDAFKAYAENTSQQINRLIEMQNQAVGQQVVMTDVIGILLCFVRLTTQNLKENDPEAFAWIVDQIGSYAAQQGQQFIETHNALLDMLCCRDEEGQGSGEDTLTRMTEWMKSPLSGKKH